MNPFEIAFIAMVGAAAGSIMACLMVVWGSRRFIKSLEEELERLKKKEERDEHGQD